MPKAKKDADAKPKAKKDPNAPKKAQSAYNLFCKDKRADVKDELGPDAGLGEISKRLGEIWKEMSEDDKEQYKEEAAEDKKRESEAAPKGKKAKKDPNAPKGALSAYILFCKDKRAEVKEELGNDASLGEVSKRLGELWKELSEGDKEPYKEEAAEDKKRYQQEMAAYTEKA